MVVEAIHPEDVVDDDHSVASSSSQVTNDQSLKDSTNKSSTENSSVTSGEEAMKFVRKESRHVFYLRVMVLLLLFAASAAISLVVYFVTDNGEQSNFESQYSAAADKVTGMSRAFRAASIVVRFNPFKPILTFLV